MYALRHARSRIGGGLVPVSSQSLTPIGPKGLPAIIGQAGEEARWRFLEFFTANIRNKNTHIPSHFVVTS
jgi:hypothetical protein